MGSGSIQALDSDIDEFNFNSSRISLAVPISDRKKNLTSMSNYLSSTKPSKRNSLISIGS
jgi:hypothetical protein